MVVYQMRNAHQDCDRILAWPVSRLRRLCREVSKQVEEANNAE